MNLWPKSQLMLSDGQTEPAGAGAAARAGGAAKPLPEDAIALIPMRNTVLFPGVIAPVTIGREKSVAAA